MNYLQAKDIAKLWDVDVSLVLRHAREGRIDGAMRSGRQWLIPHDADKPTDGRKQRINKENFRFPYFLDNKEEYYPPLSDEERRLSEGQHYYMACRFDEAWQLLVPLAETAINRYVRIAALYYCCNLAVYYTDAEKYNGFLAAFNYELDRDFPHRNEMLLLRYKMDADHSYYKSLWEGFAVTDSENYHPSCYDMLTYLSVISLVKGDISLFSKIQLDGFEVQCMQMEREGHYFSAQEMHLLLVELYRIQANIELALYHMRRAIIIAKEQGLYLCPAVNTFYYPEIVKKVLNKYPDDFSDGFAEKIFSFGRDINKMYVVFSGLQQNRSYLSLLSVNDYVYISFAVQQYTNRYVAQKLNISDQAVSKHYGSICKKLGVRTKKELVQLIINNNNGK